MSVSILELSECENDAGALDTLASRQEISRFGPISKGSRVACYVRCQPIDGESRSPIFGIGLGRTFSGRPERNDRNL